MFSFASNQSISFLAALIELARVRPERKMGGWPNRLTSGDAGCTQLLASAIGGAAIFGDVELLKGIICKGVTL